MRVALVVGMLALVLVPSAAPRGIPPGEVLYASWRVGHRFDREEWLERATGATHRRDTGGPACARHVVANRRWILRYGLIKGVQCVEPHTYRVRGERDVQLRESSDLLRPRRMLRLGQARAEGSTTVDGNPAMRVRIPWRCGTEYADLDPQSRLPLRFVFVRDGVEVDVWSLRYRAKRRASLPKDFFSPRRAVSDS
jgi:hypothetical protein